MKENGIFRRIAAAACVLALLLLSGCGGDQAQIQMQAPYQPQLSEAPVFIAPENPAVGIADASLSTQEKAEDVPVSSQASGDTSSYVDYTYTRGSVNIGMVLTGEAVLHPHKCVYRDLISLNELVFESAITLGDDLCPVGQLVDSWQMRDAIYLFHVRPNVTFHNGRAVTAADFVESWQYIKRLGSDSPWSDRIAVIKSMKVVDDTHFAVDFDYGGCIVLNAMTYPVVQRDTLDYAMPMGTGPYWYVAYSVNKYLRLEANPLWWKKNAVLPSIMAWRYSSTEKAMTALSNGEIDSLASRSPRMLTYKKLSQYTYSDYGTRAYEFLVPCLTGGKLSNLTIRQAVMYAIDRNALAMTVYAGMVQISEVPVVPGSYLYDSKAAQYNYNAERALQLLYDAGWKDNNGDGMLDTVVDGLLEYFTIKVVTYNDAENSQREDTARLIAAQLRKVGVNVEVTVTTRDKAVKGIKNGTYDMALIGVNLPYDMDLTRLLRHDGARNYSGYASKDMNSLLSSARTAETVDDLMDIYTSIQTKVINELPIMGLFFHTGITVSTHDLEPLHGQEELDTWKGLELVY
ncbi:MAG: hypothetical protein J5859_00560 [Clostridia bacterium]|nr:hypothetical protein [Clostridia bacterium]